MSVRRTAVVSMVAAGLSGCISDVGDDPEKDISYVAGWSCNGTAGSTANPRGIYYTTTFGCWTDEDGDAHGDSGDNCVPYCMGRSGWDDVCAGLSGRQCELSVNWYAANSDRFGCFNRLRVTNPDNGKSAVVVVLDRGPACWVERQVSHWVLDLSAPATNYLFGGPAGASERKDVEVEVVDDDTPLGPTTGPIDPSDPSDPTDPTDPTDPSDPPLSDACEGYCPGGAETFCATWNDEGGVCVPRTFDGDCGDHPGTVPTLVDRFVGSSGVAPARATVCVPPDVEGISCGSGAGECIDTHVVDCDGTLRSGLCPGPSNIRCCL